MRLCTYLSQKQYGRNNCIDAKDFMTHWVIGSGLSNRLSRSVRTKMECCKSRVNLSCRIMSSCVMSRHPRLTGGLIEGGRFLQPHLSEGLYTLFSLSLSLSLSFSLSLFLSLSLSLSHTHTHTIYIYIYIYCGNTVYFYETRNVTYSYACRNIVNTIKTSEQKNIPLTLYSKWYERVTKGLCVRWVGDWTKL